MKGGDSMDITFKTEQGRFNYRDSMDITFKTEQGRFNYRVCAIIIHNEKKYIFILIMKNGVVNDMEDINNLLCRCSWCNLKNQLYVKYHDEEWGMPLYDDKKLFEFLILEPFQAGLSWETKILELLQDASIIRNRRKIEAAIVNAKVFREIKNGVLFLAIFGILQMEKLFMK